MWSIKRGKPSGPNPWRATTLEWQTPETPAKHGNWGKDLPVVHRWAYDYSVPGAAEFTLSLNRPADAEHFRLRMLKLLSAADLRKSVGGEGQNAATLTEHAAPKGEPVLAGEGV